MSNADFPLGTWRSKVNAKIEAGLPSRREALDVHRENPGLADAVVNLFENERREKGRDVVIKKSPELHEAYLAAFNARADAKLEGERARSLQEA